APCGACTTPCANDATSSSRSPSTGPPSGASRLSTTIGKRSSEGPAAIATTTTFYASCASWSPIPSATTTASAASSPSASRRPCRGDGQLERPRLSRKSRKSELVDDEKRDATQPLLQSREGPGVARL